MSELWRKLLFLFRRGRFDRELEEEMRFHLDMKARKNRTAGLAAEEAEYAARRKFGNALAARERSRDAWGWGFLDSLAQDLRYALRMLRKNPGFTAVAVLSLALGIGANTALFSLMDAMLFRWLPVNNPKQQVYFINSWPGQGWQSNLDIPVFEAVKNHRQSFSGLAAYAEEDRNFRAGGVPERVTAQLVTADYFPVLGVNALIGRTLTPEDARPGAPPAAVLSYRFWKRRFGLDPGVLGRTVYLDKAPVTIVGVAPPEFFGIDAWGDVCPDLWAPLPGDARDATVWIFGRLNPRVPPAQARAELAGATAEIQERYAEQVKHWSPRDRAQFLSTGIDFRPITRGLESMRMQYSEPLRILVALSGLLLLIACANIANLLLARSAARAREIGLRLSVGAGRGRLLRQLLTESVLLASLGGALGLLFAGWAYRLLLAFLLGDAQSAVTADFTLNYRLLAFTAGASCATGILFGIVPALRATRVDLYSSVKGDGGNTLRLGFARPLLAAQVAASLLLAIGAGLFVRSLMNIRMRDPGFNGKNLLVMTLEPEGGRHKGAAVSGLYRELTERVSAIPGVRSAAFAANILFGNGGWNSTVWVDGYAYRGDERHNVNNNVVGPGFFATAGIPILAGREFGPGDRNGAPEVVMINAAFAERYLPEGSPLGRRFGDTPETARRYEVVGVVRNSRYGSLREDEAPAFYQPLFQTKDWHPHAVYLHVRTAGDTSALAERVRREVLAIDRDLPIYGVTTITDVMFASLRRDRMFATLASFFGLTALALASIGLYGMLAYSVNRRTREISIRMALGASRRMILWMVLRQALVVVAAGAAVGVPAALLASRAIRSVLFGLSPTDPATVAGALAVLAAVTALACSIPARKATKVDPMEGLRYE